MATHTFGTVAASTLTAVKFSQSPLVLLPADLATIAQGIRDEGPTFIPTVAAAAISHPVIPGAFNFEGKLILPGGRGAIMVKPGDVIAIDNRGWPIIVSADSVTNGTSWTFT